MDDYLCRKIYLMYNNLSIKVIRKVNSGVLSRRVPVYESY